LILGEGESIIEEGEIVVLERAESEEEDEANEAECKVIGVMGKMGEYQTMKIDGRLEHVGVEVLIDSGASHNFISPALVTALGLTLTPSNIKRIKLGDGHKVLTEGVCKRVSLTLGTNCFEIDALVLELGGLDVILGVSWLSTLGKVVMDWKDLTMQFLHQGEMVTLQGHRGKSLSQSCLNSFLEGLWNNEEKPAESNKQIQKKIMEVLTDFPGVFKEQIALPPERSQVHQINLLPNHGPVNVRPYKYPHHQKKEKR
jgi:hypothetical protein